jgi:uncharacterized membrane protein YkoI
MSMTRWISIAALLALQSTLSSASADEKKIPIEDLPKVVLRAAQKAFPEAKVVGASKETEDDETIYEVEMKLNGKSIDLEIDDDGEIESVEKEIDADDLPKAVTRAVEKLFPKAKISKVEEVSDEDDMVVYELTLKTPGKEETEVVFSPNGKLMEDEDDDDDDDEKGKKKEKDDDKGEKKETGEKKPKG